MPVTRIRLGRTGKHATASNRDIICHYLGPPMFHYLFLADAFPAIIGVMVWRHWIEDHRAVSSRSL
jgi:hypothetical protein